MNAADRARLAADRAGATAGTWHLDRGPADEYLVLARVPAGEGHLDVPLFSLGRDALDRRNAVCLCTAVNAAAPLLEDLARTEAARDDALHERDDAREAAADARGRAGIAMHERDTARRRAAELSAELDRVHTALATYLGAEVVDPVEGLRGLGDALRRYAGGYIGSDLADEVLGGAYTGADGAGT